MSETALDLASLSMPLAALIASLIGATATITASMINLRTAWRKEVKARERKEPVTKSSRRGPVLAVLVLMIASAVGGFSLSQYLVTEGRTESLTMEQEMRAMRDELKAVTQRLEVTRREAPAEPAAVQTQAPSLETPPRPGQAVTATVSLAPCTTRSPEGVEAPCTDKEAMRVAICAELPTGATIAGVERYVRDEGDVRPWTDVRVEAGKQPTAGLFSDEPRELSDSGSKQVCQDFQSWSTRGRLARILVNYTVP